MIIDSMNNCTLYYTVHPGFEKAFDFVRKAVAEDLPVGRYEIDGDNVYAMVQAYDTKPSETGVFEAHERYIDLQYVVSGVEKIEFLDITKATVRTPYDAAKDAAFYENSDRAGVAVLEAGDYGIFFPHDTHKPGRMFGQIPTPVKKIVAKIKVG